MPAYHISQTVGIQTILKDFGLYKGSIDGINGLRTKQAIREFQKKKGLKPDGIVGRKTRERLIKHLTEKNDEIHRLSGQLSKMQKENYFYQNQLSATYEESRKKDAQIQELTQQLKSLKEEYETEFIQNKEYIKELQSDYDNRLRIEKNKIERLVKDREYFIAETNRLENLQLVRLRKLKVIQRDLDLAIGSGL